MKTSDAWAIYETITAGIHFPGGLGDGWGAVSWGARGGDWANELLGRIILLVGNSPIEYVSGYVDDDNERLHGDIVVLTASSVIRAPFSAERVQGMAIMAVDAQVTAASRSTIIGVDVLSAAEWRGDPEAEWPRHLRAIVRTSDGGSFPLPLVVSHAYPEQSTAAILSKLIQL